MDARTSQYNQQQDRSFFRPQTHQYQLPYTEYPHLQQYAVLKRSVTGAEDNGQSSSNSCFTTKPVLFSLMPGEVHPSEINVCMAFTMDRPGFEEGPTDSNHLTQPANMMYNGNQSGQGVLMNPKPEPMFIPLENASMPRNNSFYQEEDGIIVLNNHSQAACPSIAIEQTADRHHQSSVSQSVRNSREPRSRKPCHCTKSKCLKLYCECFSHGVMCNNCNCTECHNNSEHETKRQEAIKSCLVRNPNAFRPKISGGKCGNVKGQHYKGCTCKRSGCLKNYCECYEANIRCTPSCKCVGCRNHDVNLSDRHFSVKQQTPMSAITSAVVETVSECLLARAAEAVREQCSEAWAQQEILQEFGHCLALIATTMCKKHT